MKNMLKEIDVDNIKKVDTAILTTIETEDNVSSAYCGVFTLKIMLKKMIHWSSRATE